MFEYKTPEIEVVEFDNTDILTESYVPEEDETEIL